MALEGQGLFGVATSKAIGCHARRNRQKRRIKAAWQEIVASPQLDWICVVKPSIVEAPFAEIVDELRGLAAQLDVLAAKGDEE